MTLNDSMSKRSSDSCFHDGTSCYHRMGWLHYIWQSQSCWISFRTTLRMSNVVWSPHFVITGRLIIRTVITAAVGLNHTLQSLFGFTCSTKFIVQICSQINCEGFWIIQHHFNYICVSLYTSIVKWSPSHLYTFHIQINFQIRGFLHKQFGYVIITFN